MKHTMVTFQLHKKGVILIVILCLIVAVLLVAAGYVWGRQSAAKQAAAVAQKPAPAKPASAAPPAPAAPVIHYTLRIGIETSEEEAQAKVKELGLKKLAATVVPMETSGGAVLYEIRTGAYPDRAAAAKAATALEENLQMPAAVVPVQ